MISGLLLVNLGTPANSNVFAVGCYLRKFLSDKRVINVPVVIRYLLLYGFILPLKLRNSAKAYQSIWTVEGSPLLVHSNELKKKLQNHLGLSWKVELGMRYGKPSIEEALDRLSSCTHLTILPLYPQYSSAATGSAIEAVLSTLAAKTNIPSLTLIRDFYQQPAYINAQAALVASYISQHDYILFSYHGLPESHLTQIGCRKDCSRCSLGEINPNCYKAQCYKTTQMLMEKLNLEKKNCGIAFQSRLGKTPWIQPYLEDTLIQLAKQGIKRLAVACPSFVADCLETLEEIGIRARKQWLELGGEKFTLIPCLNDNELWIQGIIDLIKPIDKRIDT